MSAVMVRAAMAREFRVARTAALLAAAELERQRETVKTLRKELAQLRRARERDREDAARWRYVRDHVLRLRDAGESGTWLTTDAEANARDRAGHYPRTVPEAVDNLRRVHARRRSAARATLPDVSQRPTERPGAALAVSPDPSPQRTESIL